MRAAILVVTCALSAEAFVNPSSSSRSLGTQLEAHKKTTNKSPKNALVSAALATSVLVAASNPLPSKAYIPSDYASDTVQEAVQALKDASGNADSTFKVYEDIAGIITEGKGVGGMVNYSKFPLCFALFSFAVHSGHTKAVTDLFSHSELSVFSSY